jgi:hypothetical protein
VRRSCGLAETGLDDTLIVRLNPARGGTGTLTFDNQATRLRGISLLK